MNVLFISVDDMNNDLGSTGDLGGARTTIGGTEYAVSYGLDGSVSLQSVDNYKATGRVNFQPATYSSVGVGEEFTKIHAVGKKVIVPRSGASTPFLKELLNKIGIDVLEIHLYDVCAFRDTTQWNEFRELFSKGEVDGIIFTSASSVRGFFEIMSKDYEEKTLLDNLENLSVVSIGPFTSDELKKFKIKNIVAEVHTVAGAFDSMKSTLTVA